MHVCILSAIVLAVVVVFYRLLQSDPARTISRIYLTNLEDVLKLLHSPGVPLPELLRTRADANQRLRRAFHLESTFVSADPAVHSAFVKAATELISPRLTWSLFAEIAVHAASLCLPSSQGSIALDIYVQRVCMYVVLVAVLHADIDDSSSHLVEDLDLMTRGITDLWQQSKTTANPSAEILAQLNSRLRAWLPTRENPIELIIPAYETMWRVVAIAVALIGEDKHARTAFEEYLQNPTHPQFTQFYGELPSVQAIVSEVLRLYPPTRRISRVVTRSRLSSLPTSIARLFRLQHETTVSADIEAVQRGSVWGPTAQEFDAMRHHPARCTDVQRATMLAFGAGHLGCVAKNWAPQAGALIIAAVLETLGDSKECRMGVGKEIGGREGWEGWSVIRSD